MAGGIWTTQFAVFPENTASLIPHERAGFRRVGGPKGIGRHGGRWGERVLLERNSPLVA
ncbi:GNAT family N-acetyltransferase [Micromonospora sp. DT47]|uniref:GNAT family N-acetyltransferase n=1 Tax=Micromonospora sp. DT47 TaxID=3393431 RepID=UPI003CEDF872